MTAADDDRDGEVPDAAIAAFDSHDAFTPLAGEAADVGDHAGAAFDSTAYTVDTTGFDAVVTAMALDGYADRYEVAVFVPSLDATTVDHVSPAVQSGWFETMERRLADAPKSTRAAVDLASFRFADADEPGDVLRVSYAFTFGDADRAAGIAKTFVEYVEGTYVESTIPGYEYTGVVGDLLASATGTGGAGEGGSSGSMPL
jgi:hypothetical protein